MSRPDTRNDGFRPCKPGSGKARPTQSPGEAIPGHLVQAPTKVLWIRAAELVPDFERHRADWRRNLLRVVWQLAAHAGSDMVTDPGLGATWELLAAKAGVSRRTFADRLRWLRTHGLLFTLVTGSTPALRASCWGGRVDDGLGNIAAEYALTVPRELLDTMDFEDLDRLIPPTRAPAEENWRDVPWPAETLPVDETRTPKGFIPPLVKEVNPPVHTREAPFPAKPGRTWPSTVTPGNKSEMLQACERLRDDDMLLRKVPARQLRWLLRSLFVAGATAGDVRHALHFHPDGTLWPVGTPRRPVSWIRWRLGAWIDYDTGALRAALPSQRRAEADLRRRREQAALTDWLAGLRAGRADPDPAAVTELRARLEAVRERARRPRYGMG
ncbi:hypothetical protein Pve01_63930 [Planomonospora venezuelensis]|nr:hypothetical protein Pve01_63930 [Planomonospora venezuelensis]